MLTDCYDDQLTRSVLYRSAASLAMQCGEFAQAEQLIDAGLQEEPPDESAEELRDLRDQVAAQQRTGFADRHSA